MYPPQKMCSAFVHPSHLISAFLFSLPVFYKPTDSHSEFTSYSLHFLQEPNVRRNQMFFTLSVYCASHPHPFFPPKYPQRATNRPSPPPPIPLRLMLCMISYKIVSLTNATLVMFIYILKRVYAYT